MNKNEASYTFGMIGLGTMGRNMLLNMADHGFAVAGYDKDPGQVTLLEQEGQGKPVKAFSDIGLFVASLQSPRSIILLVPAGSIVDSVIAELIPLLQAGDIIVDGGNSHFTDTTRRGLELTDLQLHFFGMGISGGEEGARHGPSMMPGGDREAYARMQPVFEAIAARVDGIPCVTYIGPGASGHFVKMVHNGIEYGLMQLISEAYGFMKQGLDLDDAAIGSVFGRWTDGRLQSFLLDITRDIFLYQNTETGHLLLDDIKDEARAKGTGKWTSQVAMDLETPVPGIDTAVALRDLSRYKALREQAAAMYGGAGPLTGGTQASWLLELEQAFYCGMVITYAQGMHLLARASKEYQYELDLAAIARIWRGGCIIRAQFLDEILNAYQKDKGLQHLLLDGPVRDALTQSLPGARSVASAAISAGLAMPALAASISYFDSFRCGRMPSNLIQAQRDYFGAHTYEITGKDGFFHTDWLAGNPEDLLHNG